MGRSFPSVADRTPAVGRSALYGRPRDDALWEWRRDQRAGRPLLPVRRRECEWR